MVRRLSILLTLVVLVALWLALRPGESAAVAPAGTKPIDERTGHVELIALEDSEPSGAERTSLEFATESIEAEPDTDDDEDRDPSASLTVRVFLPDGVPWAEGHVQILARSSPVTQLRFGRRVRARSGASTISSAGPDGHSFVTSADEHGILELLHVESNLPITVRLIDGLGFPVVSAAGIVLQAEERREIELWAPGFPVPLSGRCVDEDGRPLAGATVELSSASEEPFAIRFGLKPTVDENGEFVTAPLYAPHVNLRASFDGLIATERSDVAVGGAPVEIVLRRGRRLLVEMRDGSGRPYSDVGLRVHEPGVDGPLDVPWERCDEGRLFPALPDRPLELRWGSPCAEESLVVEAGVERVLVHVQWPGTLAVEFGKLPGDIDEDYLAGLFCADGATSAFPPKSVLNTGRQQAQWTLAPGRYLLQLQHLPAHAPEAWVPWGAPIEVEVRSGETTLERLGS